jgi:hypothetical protein
MKKLIFLSAIFTLFLLAGQIGAKNLNTPKEKSVTIDFENVPIGQIPDGWQVEATNPKGKLAVWKVTEDSTAPSGHKVLTLVDASHSFGNTYNLCWTKNISFLNGIISVKFKANSGREDEGGGVIWRAKDRNNYYIARFNPLENNFRIYYVKNGVRRMLASARIALKAHRWHSMKIVVNGNRFEGYLNGKKLLSTTCKVFNKAGGVGLWTKADAATSFDDFQVNMQP